LGVFAVKSHGVAVEKRPVTQNEAGSAHTERDEADYAVVRPTDVADDDDVSGDYAYPTAPASASDNNPSRDYLCLLPEPDEPLRLVAVFTRPEADITTSVSGTDDYVTKVATDAGEDNELHLNDALDSATGKQQPATYIEIIT